MNKVNRKAIEANLRNKLAAQYKAKSDNLQKRIECLDKSYREMYERVRQAEIERDELKDKLQQYEDWNRRLQEYMDMSDDDRKAYIENLHNQKEFDGLIKKLGLCSELFSGVFV